MRTSGSGPWTSSDRRRWPDRHSEPAPGRRAAAAPSVRHASPALLSLGGGGTAPFHVWQRAVPDDVELVLLRYPGREARQVTPFPPTWDALVEDATRAVPSPGPAPVRALPGPAPSW